MSLGRRLKYRRLRRLHSRFLAAARKFPSLGHVVCRSHVERLKKAMAPSWWNEGKDADHSKQYKRFWSEACCYGDFARYVICGDFVTHAEVVYFDDFWFGRFADEATPEDECPRGEYGEYKHPGMELWYGLSGEALDHLGDLHHPPVVVYTPDDEVRHGANPWVNWLYFAFRPRPERYEASGPDPWHPLLCEPGEWFEVAGLACNVFLASARLVEKLADISLRDSFSGKQKSERDESAGANTKQTAYPSGDDDVLIRQPLGPLQRAVLISLAGKSLKKEALAEACQVDPSRLYRRNGLKELMAIGRVAHLDGIGYYRPDAPPADALELRLRPNGPQDAPKASPPATN